METKHTPEADWEIHQHIDYGTYFIPALKIRGDAADTNEELKAVESEEAANQKLLQAAPKILRALYDIASKAARVVERWESGDLAGAVRELDQSRREAREVIATATEESQ